MRRKVSDGSAAYALRQSSQNDFLLLFDEGAGLGDDVIDVTEAFVKLFDPFRVKGLGLAPDAVSHIVVAVLGNIGSQRGVTRKRVEGIDSF